MKIPLFGLALSPMGVAAANQVDSNAQNSAEVTASPGSLHTPVDIIDIVRRRHKFNWPTEKDGMPITPPSWVAPQSTVEPTATSTSTHLQQVPNWHPHPRAQEYTDSAVSFFKVPAHTSWETRHSIPAHTYFPDPAALAAKNAVAPRFNIPHRLASRQFGSDTTSWATWFTLNTAMGPTTYSDNYYYQDTTNRCFSSPINRCIYFELTYANGKPWTPPTSNRDSTATGPVILYISTNWILSYPKHLVRALFNEADAPHGLLAHDRSVPIFVNNATDSEPLFLHHLSHSIASAYTDSSHTYTDIFSISAISVPRGRLARLSTSTAPPAPVLEFIENQMRSVYPSLEIGLILLFTITGPVLAVLWLLFRYAKAAVGKAFWRGVECVGERLNKGLAKKRGTQLSDVEMGDWTEQGTTEQESGRVFQEVVWGYGSSPSSPPPKYDEVFRDRA